MKIVIINGPNLNLLGLREPEVYGNQSFEEFFGALQKQYADVTFEYHQSNSEGQLIDFIHEHGFLANGIILNAGGYTHTSVALADAIAGIDAPVVEVHISNVFKRELFRHHSFITPVCMGVISGFGLHSYRLGVEALLER